MREIFPSKAVGDPLEASHVNRLSTVARRVASGVVSVGMNGNDGFLNPPPLFVMTTVEVIEGSGTLLGTDDPTEDGQDPNQVKVRPRYWHTKDEEDGEDQDEWRERDDDNKYDIDIKSTNTKLEVGDLLHAFWHPQRDQYLAVPPDRQNTVVPIRNDTSSTLRKYDVVGIESIVNEPPNSIGGLESKQEQGRFEDQICLTAVDANDPMRDGIYRGKFAIIQSPDEIESDKIGWAVVGGLTAVRLHLESESHEFADVEVADELPEYEDRTADDNPVIPLKSSTSGSFRILWKEKDTPSEEGDWMWAIGIIGATLTERRRAKTVGALIANGVTTAELYDWSEDDGFTLTGEIVEVRTDILDTGEIVLPDSDIWITKSYGTWWFDDTRCSFLRRQ